MKLSDAKINEKFKTDSGVEFTKLSMSKNELRLHPDKFKVQRLDTKQIFYLTDMIIIKS